MPNRSFPAGPTKWPPIPDSPADFDQFRSKSTALATASPTRVVWRAPTARRPSIPVRRPAYPIAAILALLLASSLVLGHPTLDSGYQRTTDKAFENVLWDLRFAVTQRNFRIVGRNRIGKALRQRGHEDFPRAQVLEFCNLSHTRRALELDRRFLRSCPNRIAVYEGPEGVVISAELWPVMAKDPEKAAIAREVNGLLREMVDFAAD